jgi:AcrR family transcriptional regulator
MSLSNLCGGRVVCGVIRSEFVARSRNPEITVSALLAAARVEFGRVGFAEAKTETIVERAGITRGALYHHFADKTALYTAVVEQVLDEINSEVALAAAAEASPLAALRKGIAAYLQCCTRAEVRRIVLQDGPAVLGRERWIEIDERNAYDVTRRGIVAAIENGELAPAPAEPLTRLLLGMVTQAGLDIGRAKRPALRKRELAQSIEFVLDRLATG